MFELFKIVWDLVVLRDAARKDRLHWRIWPIAFGFVLLEYCIALPAVVLYDKHPQYEPVFIAALFLVAINFVVFIGWAWRWQLRHSALRSSNDTATGQRS
jgi:hypothetical protein